MERYISDIINYDTIEDVPTETLDDLMVDDERDLSVNDPLINYNRIYRELRRLEEHLSDPTMYCPSCMYKHSTTAKIAANFPEYKVSSDIVDLLDEANSLDDKGVYSKVNKEVRKIVSKLPKRFARVVVDKEPLTEKEKHSLLQDVRKVRRMITHLAMESDLRTN